MCLDYFVSDLPGCSDLLACTHAGERGRRGAAPPLERWPVVGTNCHHRFKEVPLCLLSHLCCRWCPPRNCNAELYSAQDDVLDWWSPEDFLKELARTLEDQVANSVHRDRVLATLSGSSVPRRYCLPQLDSTVRCRMTWCAGAARSEFENHDGRPARSRTSGDSHPWESAVV